MTLPTPNADESLVAVETVNPGAPAVDQTNAPFIGNFHKTLPHNMFGEVAPADYRKFERVCVQLEAGAVVNFEDVPSGPLVPSIAVPQTAFVATPTPQLLALTKSVARFVSPLAGAASESFGPDPKSLDMLPAPGCRSLTAMAEMVELYWMALLRDAPLLVFQDCHAAPDAGCAPLPAHNGQLGYDVTLRTNDAVSAVNQVFDIAIRLDKDPGKLRAPLDVATDPSGARIIRQTLFRSGLKDEEFGPLLSQFFLRSVGYGVQTIDARQVPYVAKVDFLTSHGDWLLAQNTGKDKFGRDYGSCNSYADQQNRGAQYYPPGNPVRLISTMRDIARFVNRDALHQAYFNAALFLLGVGAPLDEGNPYRGNRYSRETAFATLGGPDLLTLVSEVASRALKVVWRQKWLVHRRARPEAIAGLIQMQLRGLSGNKREYGLATAADGAPSFKARLDSTLHEVELHNAGLNGGAGTYFLPMAFSAGSPTHPAYGAGHATVAGACVTVLKAWFDEDATLKKVFSDANARVATGLTDPNDPPGGTLQLLQPGYRKQGAELDDFCPPQTYS
ncbi:MAG: hypothetical protein RL685_891, partial [Pseudomonadota bacterium]